MNEIKTHDATTPAIPPGLKRDTCCKKVLVPGSGGLRLCGRPVVYLTREQAQELRRGKYSGYYHTAPGQNHHAVPTAWVK